MNKALDLIFSTYFNGESVRVNSNGLYAEGSMEGNCKLVYKSRSWIVFETDTQWNGTTKMAELFQRLICDKKEELNLTYDQRDAIIKAIIPGLNDAPVMIGSLYYSEVVKFDCTTSDKGDIKSIDLIFKNGGVVQIRKTK